MNSNIDTPFIFFVTLAESLPKAFYMLADELRQRGFMLVPVKVDQLSVLVSGSEQNQVIAMTSIADSRELKLYNEKVRPLLKYVLKSKRLSLMVLSSFSIVNDVKKFSLTKNYFFMKYPLDASQLSAKIVKYYNLKEETNVRWPGGKRAGLGGVV